jgi:hypothetical protein
MAQMTARSVQLGSASALAGSSVPRTGPFTSARPAPRSLVVRSQNGSNDVAMKTVAAIAAAQIALMPLAGAAMADTFPLAAVGNPAAEFANKSKSVANKAKGAAVPNPIDALSANAKSVTQDAKASVNGAGVPDPLKSLQSKAKSAAKSVGNNPAQDFANKGKSAVAKAKPAVNKAKANVSNPAREFALNAEKAKKKLPFGTIDYTGLQQNVLFGIGEKKAQKAVSKASDVAGDVANKAGDVANKADVGNVADKAGDVAKKVDENTPNSFSIFDAGSVNEARQKLKSNIDEAVNQKSDPAERVASIGKPGESQEANAERIRREAENGNVAGGDARAPTN